MGLLPMTIRSRSGKFGSVSGCGLGKKIRFSIGAGITGLGLDSSFNVDFLLCCVTQLFLLHLFRHL